MHQIRQRISTPIVRHLLAAAAIAALASPAMAQVSTVNLTFDGTEGGQSNTGFDAAYNLDPTGFNVNSGGNSKLGLLTLDGDTYGNYENDPDTAKNFFYKNFNAGDRTVVQARVNVLNLNNNFHGGGIWMGTDTDHYIRLGLVYNSFEGGVTVEALRENEDRWTTGGTYPNRPGFDIESRNTGINDSSTQNAVNTAGRDVTAILRLVRDKHAVAAYYSLDNGATFVRAGGDGYSFNALAIDKTSLPIDNTTTANPTNPDTSSPTVEGGYKIGAYALGGGGAQRAVVQLDTFNGISGTPIYTGPDSGDYTNGANWGNNNGIGAPTNIESTAVLPNTANARVLTVGSDITATSINFDSAAGTTINGTGQIRFDWFFFPTHPNYYTDGPGVVSVSQGTHVINAPTTVAHLHDFNIASGGVLNLTNMVASPAENLDAGVRKLGNGTMRVNHLLTSNVNVQAGTLAVSPLGTAAGVSTVHNVTVNTASGSTAKLDLTNNGLVIDYDAAAPTSPLAATAALVKSGFNGGAWNGAGIVSSSAAADARYALGFAEASALGTGGVPSLFGTVDTSAVLIRYTLKGDANIDGKVAFADLVLLAQNYNGNGKVWSQGDFNYDGTVAFADLVSLAQNYNQSLSAAQASVVGSSFASDYALALSLVPEPTTLGLLAGMSTLMLGRRRTAR